MLTVTIHGTISRQSIYISTKDNLRCLSKAVLKVLWRLNLFSEQDSKPQWDSNIAGGCSSLCENGHSAALNMLLKRELFGFEVSFSEDTVTVKIHGCSPTFWKNRAVIALSHPNTNLCLYDDLTLYLAKWWYKSSSPHLGSHGCVRFYLTLSLVCLKYFLF